MKRFKRYITEGQEIPLAKVKGLNKNVVVFGPEGTDVASVASQFGEKAKVVEVKDAHDLKKVKAALCKDCVVVAGLFDDAILHDIDNDELAEYNIQIHKTVKTLGVPYSFAKV